MIVLMRAWCNNPGVEDVGWALVSLNQEMVELCLARIELAKQVAKDSSYQFYGIHYWSYLPLWEGYCETWDVEYAGATQIITDGLIPGEHSSVAVECSLMLVTTEGIEWHATVRHTSAKVETAVLSHEMLLKIQECLQRYGDTGE